MTQLELADGSRRADDSCGEVWQITASQERALTDMALSRAHTMGMTKGEGAASWFHGRDRRQEVSANHATALEDKRSRHGNGYIRCRRVRSDEEYACRMFVIIDDFPALPITNTWMDIGDIQSRADPKIYVVQTSTCGYRTLHAHGHRSRGSYYRSNMRFRDHGFCSRAMGATLDHNGHFTRALALARQRIMGAKFPLLYPCRSRRDIHKGFVYEQIPHITLETIAQ